MNKYEQEINRNTTINSYTGENVRHWEIMSKDGYVLAWTEVIKDKKGYKIVTNKLKNCSIESSRLYTYAAAKLQRYIDSIILMEEDVKSKGL